MLRKACATPARDLEASELGCGLNLPPDSSDPVFAVAGCIGGSVVVVVVERTTSPRGKGNMASSRSAGTDGVVAEASYVTHALNWICRARTVM